ncbi:WD-REPEATS-REGION domain-containing protein [Mycena chlorophos]|uniref:Polyadenylation factor subunit 2 n=1 Tax=Mycena chlorophos TaxID=658473 RepID=A0A8H6T3U5_MYCCL|nr:WD-REPEATS-REGION domain-containing protein [Mycena chlorophos]
MSLLPPSAIPRQVKNEWRPSRYLSEPQPPPVDEAMRMQELEAVARAMADGKPVKKTRPRRTVDYNGPLGRWTLLRKLRPNQGYLPTVRPAVPFIIDLYPPKAYRDNASTSLCTKFIHTSTNKVRCPVNVVTWTPEGRRVLTGSTSGEFTLWNGLTFNFETILQAHDNAICTLTFTHSGQYLASADKAGTIKYFEPNMNNLAAWQGSNSHEAIRGLSFSPDDRRFATASDDSSVRIWSFQERRVESILEGHGWDVKCVEWHPTKGLLVSGSKDNDVKFWDPRSGTVLSTLHHHKNTIQALSWSPNGDMVASASRDQTVRVFDIRAMKEFRIFKGHKKEVCSVTWHPVHPILVSGGSEGAILHWDITEPEPSFGQPPHPPRANLAQAHDSNVWSLQFHPLGHLLASASNDHTTRFWSRERPGDTASVFVGGGARPVEVPQEQDAYGYGEMDEEDVEMAPGFGAGPAQGGGAPWWEQNGQDNFGRNVRDGPDEAYEEMPWNGNGNGNGNENEWRGGGGNRRGQGQGRQTLVLKYMRLNQPFDELPMEYFLGSGQCSRPPEFVYGFGFPRAPSIAVIHAQLRAMQQKIPHQDLADRQKITPLKALVQYMKREIDVPVVCDMDMITVEGAKTPIVFYMFNSHNADTAYLPVSVKCTADQMQRLFKELGWDEVPSAKWYLTALYGYPDDEEDFNIVPKKRVVLH